MSVNPYSSGGGDILDQALHAARTQTRTVPGQKGFFKAVAGERSPLNRQSSRIAKPFAVNTYLGDPTQATVATPAQQALLAKSNATDPHTPGPIRKEAVKIVQEYVKAADTRKPIAQHEQPVGRGHAASGPVTFAQTAPNLAAVGQRALSLVGSGIPLGSVAPAALRAISSLGLDPKAKQQVIAGFARDKTLSLPGVGASLAAAALARGNSFPAHPTTTQLLTAALADHKGGSYWDVIKNLPKDALYTPVYAAEGGFALGHATRAALPTGIGGKGDTSELAAIGKSQLQMAEHPGAFVQQHPFQAALMAIGAAKGVGGIAGKVAKLPETARDVTLSNYPLSPINRGTLDQNLTVRLAQKTSDALLARGPEALQSEALKNRVQGAHSTIVRERGLNDRKQFSEYADAKKGISRRRQASLLQNEAQGLTATEREGFYRAVGEKPTQQAQAKLAGAQAKKFDQPLTPKEERFLTAARDVAQRRTGELVDDGKLSPEAALRRDYQPLVHVRAQQGDATATSILDVERQLRSMDDARSSPDPATRDAAVARVAELNRQHNELVKQFASEQPAEPFRVPMVKPKVKSEFNTPGQPVRANANLPITGIGKARSYGDQLRSGNFTQTPEAFNRQLLEVHTAQDAKAFVEHVVNPKNGLSRPVANGEALPDAVRENYVLRNTDNLRTKPKNADASVDAADFTNAEADALSTLKNLDEGWTSDPNEMLRVPADGNFVLVPRPVYDQITKNVARVRPGSGAAKLQSATRAFKTGVLMTRPTYPLTNLVSNVAQAGIGGAGLTSWTRALRGSVPLAPGVQDAGFIAREFGHGAQQTARSLLDEGKPLQAIKQATLGNYIKTIRDLSIAVDNKGREAMYAKAAVGEAKTLAGKGFLAKFKPADDAVHEWLQKMADGDTPETRAAAERAVQKVNDLMGDYGSMRSNPALDATIPFHRWTRFVFALMLKTLPLKYTGRDLALYDLGNIGQQGSSQRGALPQYLQESIPLGGSPTAAWGLTTSRANSFASPGTMLEPTPTGGVDIAGAINQLSPFAGIGYGALTGKNLETGQALRNGAGKPIASLEDRARFIGAQASGFVPPIGALSGGITGKADTSIPFLAEQKRPAKKVPLGGVQPHQPAWLPILNQISPVRITLRNETADQYKGFKSFAAQLRKAFKDEMKAKATTPEKSAAIVKKYSAIGAEAAKRKAYFEKNPKALAALLSGGSDATELP
ncbi:MAG: hypothetical protein H0X39_00215 [Actinobacteria bacterium]|nr:hypothetical protein [Actinomycetota bacterium]